MKVKKIPYIVVSDSGKMSVKWPQKNVKKEEKEKNGNKYPTHEISGF